MPTPTIRTPELVETVLSRIAQGETLTSIARDLGFHPITWNKWLRADERLSIAHAQARAVGADVIADDILAIVDEAALSSEGISKAKLRAETRLKLLAKWQPKTYGDKVGVEHSGPDGAPIEVNSTVGLAVAAVRELRGLRMDKGSLPPADTPESLPAPSDGEDLL